MNMIRRLISKLYEDCGLESHQIPGLAIYAKNPLIGVRFFSRQLKITLATYVFIFGTCLITFATQYRKLYNRSLCGLIALMLSLAYSGGMASIKFLMYQMFIYLDTSQPRPELKRRMIRDMRKRIYLYNLTYTSVNYLFYIVIAMYSLVVISKNLVIGGEVHSWQVGLCSAIALIRHRMLINRFNDTFMNLNTYEINPYGMEQSFYTTENRESLPDECSICMLDYEQGDRLLNFGCPANHTFHEVCLSKWLVAGKACPICRQEVV
jgi:Ring finger domain